jgi:hypothetical protein
MALTSARILADEIGCGLRVVWESVPDQRSGPISDLFEDVTSVPLAEMERAATHRHSHHVPGPVPEVEARLRGGETVLMSSWCFIWPAGMAQHEFNERLHRQYASLKPLPSLLARVPALPEGTVGVHIRRGDHWRSTRYSPLALFFRVLDRHCRKEPAIRFFLASDSPEVVRQMRERYGQRILSPAATAESGITGAQSALVDVLTLARTRMIYHGFMSSFAYTAHLISRRPIRCVSVPRLPAGWHDSPSDKRHDRLMEWDADISAWQKRALPDARYATRLRAEILYRWTRFVCSDPFQRWPLRRMRRIA